MMLATLKTEGLWTPEQIHAFLDGSQPLGFEISHRGAAYGFFSRQLERLAYDRLSKADKSLVRRYLGKVTGFSRAQMARLIRQHRDTGASPIAGSRPAGRSRVATPARTFCCSPRSMPCTRRSRDRLRASSASGPSHGSEIDAEIERLSFPIVLDSGFATGEATRERDTLVDSRETVLPAGALRLAWWGRLGPHWRDRAGHFRVRWVDGAGERGAIESLDRPRGLLIANKRLRAGDDPGPWTLELLFGDDVVHSETLAAPP